MTHSPVIWTIAGSDPTGGAGIQADIKTANSLGAYACSIVTAVTVQNAGGVHSINPVDKDVLLAQLRCLEHDKPPRIIKIGLLASSEQVELVSEEIRRLKKGCQQRPTVVYDPVAIASSGGSLTQDNTVEAIKQYLLPLVDVLTPNQPELQTLTDITIHDWADYQIGAQKLVEMGVKSAVIKGGHVSVAPQHSVDFCLEGGKEYWLASERLDTDSHHGTGCTFASAIASLMAQGYLLRDSFTLAKAYINQGLRACSESGAVWQGPWPSNPQDFPQVLVPNSPLARQFKWRGDQGQYFARDFASTQCQKLGLYPVVDSVDWCERLLKLGIKTLQYREKTLAGQALEQAVENAIALGRQYDARLFINDYWQLAIKHQAYGVHLGQEDLCEADLAAIKHAGLRLGVSTHGHYEMLKAMQFQPSYLAVGAIFPTKTKDMTGQIQGVKTLNDLVALNPDVPTVAIGGINIERAPQVAATGVGSIAVVTAITEADDPEQAVNALQKIVASH